MSINGHQDMNTITTDDISTTKQNKYTKTNHCLHISKSKRGHNTEINYVLANYYVVCGVIKHDHVGMLDFPRIGSCSWLPHYHGWLRLAGSWRHWHSRLVSMCTQITRFMGQHGAHLGQQDPGGPHVGPMNLAIWVVLLLSYIWFAFVDARNVVIFRKIS